MASCCGTKKVYTAHYPRILGEDEGVAIQVMATVTVMGMRPNEKTWARGSHIQSLVDAGWLVIL